MAAGCVAPRARAWRVRGALFGGGLTTLPDYMHARYYDQGTGRFLSVDPGGWDEYRPQTWNRYVYAENNPILKVDPDGRQTAVPLPGVGPIPPVAPALYHAQQMRTNPSYRRAAVNAFRKLQGAGYGLLALGILAVSRPFLVTPSGTILPGGKDINLVPTATGTDWLQMHDTHVHGTQPHTHRPELHVGPNGEINVERTDNPTTAEDIDEADKRVKDGGLRPRANRDDKGDLRPKPQPKKKDESKEQQ
ncbi:MAG: RHS repeat-associated core domain-containing protein [Thermoanaerobaculia bacterium]